MNKFDSIKVGDKAEIKHIITQEDVNQFVELTGDDNRLHVDEDFARTTTFKQPVAHGMLGASFISTIIGTKLPGDGALWYSQNLNFLLPVRVGNELTIKAEVLKKILRTNSIELKTNIYNQDKQLVTSGTALVKLIEPSVPVKDDATQGSAVRKVAMIIGATGGIGSATCLRLAQDGYDIIVHYNTNKEKAKQLRNKIVELGQKAYCVQGDVTSEESVKEIITQARRKTETISALINCSAIKIPRINFTDLEWEDVEAHFIVNIKANFYLLKQMIPIMLKQKYGKIVHITTQAIEMPNAKWLPYITAKSALHGFTKALAVEFAPKGIRINMVSPGMTDTDLIADIPEKNRLIEEAKTPLRKIASPMDIAGAISFLVSEKANFLAGETIRVNGGQIMI